MANKIKWGRYCYDKQYIYVNESYVCVTIGHDDGIDIHNDEIDDLIIKLLLAKQMIADGDITEGE